MQAAYCPGRGPDVSSENYSRSPFGWTWGPEVVPSLGFRSLSSESATIEKRLNPVVLSSGYIRVHFRSVTWIKKCDVQRICVIVI